MTKSGKLQREGVHCLCHFRDLVFRNHNNVKLGNKEQTQM